MCYSVRLVGQTEQRQMKKKNEENERAVRSRCLGSTSTVMVTSTFTRPLVTLRVTSVLVRGYGHRYEERKLLNSLGNL